MFPRPKRLQTARSLKPRHPYDLVPDDIENTDLVYTPRGTAVEKTYANRALWWVFYNIDKIIEYKMTDKDKELFEEYKQQLIEEGELSE